MGNFLASIVGSILQYERSHPFPSLIFLTLILSCIHLIPIYGVFIFEMSIAYLCVQIFGTIIGFFAATLIICFATVVGACLAFFTARYLAASKVRRILKKYPVLETVNMVVGDKDASKTIMILRLSPTPTQILSYAMGVSSVTFEQYIWGTWGLLPHTMIDVIAGCAINNAEDVLRGDDALPWYFKAMTVGLIMIFVLGAVFIYKKIHAKLNNQFSQMDDSRHCIDLESPDNDQRRVNATPEVITARPLSRRRNVSPPSHNDNLGYSTKNSGYSTALPSMTNSRQNSGDRVDKLIQPKSKLPQKSKLFFPSMPDVRKPFRKKQAND